MLLFVMFLFQNLPHYVPKTTIIFSTMLGVSLSALVLSRRDRSSPNQLGELELWIGHGRLR